LRIKWLGGLSVGCALRSCVAMTESAQGAGMEMGRLLVQLEWLALARDERYVYPVGMQDRTFNLSNPNVPTCAATEISDSLLILHLPDLPR